MDKKHLAILFGGKSTEHEVSVISALQIYKKLKADFKVTLIYISKQNKWYTGKKFLDIKNYKNLQDIKDSFSEVILGSKSSRGELRVIYKRKRLGLFKQQLDFNNTLLCFHGGSGENGDLQGMFDMYGIKYIGCNKHASSICFNKITTKNILNDNNILNTNFLHFNKKDWLKKQKAILDDVQKQLKLPYFSKPANAGSSIGVAKNNNLSELKNSIEVALKYDNNALVEQGVKNAREFNISVASDEDKNIIVSQIEEVFAYSEFLNFADKYEGGDKSTKGLELTQQSSAGMENTNRKIPAEIDKELQDSIINTAKKAYKILDCYGGLVRIDFLWNKKELFLVEVNSVYGQKGNLLVIF